jgi:hypothetical protein
MTDERTARTVAVAEDTPDTGKRTPGRPLEIASGTSKDCGIASIERDMQLFQ